MRIFIPLLCLLYAVKSYGQLGVKTHKIPGVKPILGDYLYMKETEVSNAEYNEFLMDLKNNGDIENYWKNYPDTSVWRSQLAYNEPFVQYYFQHIAYKDYPVVGITQKQVDNYCKWRRAKLLELLKKENSKITDILVRLPTKKEWEMGARGGLGIEAIFPLQGNEIRIVKGKKRDLGKIYMNTINIGSGSLNDAGFITTPVYSYWENGYGLYNMCGNVAEWINEPGKSKGGAWSQIPYYCRIDVPGKYDGDTLPQSFIGFRYVIEIVNLKSNNIVIPKLNAKKIEAQFVKADSFLLVGITEVSNAWFQTFLYNSKLNKYASNDTFWNVKDDYKYHLMYSNHAIYKDYPVVNISHEAAEKYCEWLTDFYNQLPDKKYKKARFRLPTDMEWEKSARGGRVGNTFPWGGPYSRNSKGCFLANYNPLPDAFVKDDSLAKNFYRKLMPYDSSKSRNVDGAEFTAPVKSYFPNDFGLYNCSGNAAEMTQTPGITLGGSWDSEEYYLQLGNQFHSDSNFQKNKFIYQKQTVPLPTVGFRVFVEVLK